jgi:hypothetical protein
VGKGSIDRIKKRNGDKPTIKPRISTIKERATAAKLCPMIRETQEDQRETDAATLCQGRGLAIVPSPFLAILENGRFLICQVFEP